jgi:hypothetical protein
MMRNVIFGFLLALVLALAVLVKQGMAPGEKLRGRRLVVQDPRTVEVKSDDPAPTTNLNLNKQIQLLLEYQKQQPVAPQQPQHQGPVKQRIVILAGPHDVVASNVQTNLSEWFIQGLLKHWVWALPDNPDTFTNIQGYLDKGFAPLLAALREDDLFIKTGVAPDAVIEAYKSKFAQIWAQGQSILIGAEAIDYIQKPGCTSVLDKLLSILPGSTQDVTVVIQHREPRDAHLHFIWQQVGKAYYFFSDFIKRGAKEYLFMMDSIGLAHKFRSKGIATVLVDIEGVQKKGISVPHLVACSVLDLPCDPDPKLKGVKHELTLKPQKVRGKDDVKSMAEVSLVLSKYDCQFVSMLTDSRVKLLHRLNMFGNCPPPIQKISLEQTGDEIAKLV